MQEIAQVKDVPSPSLADVPRSNRSFHNLRYVLLVGSGVAMGLMMFLRLSVTVALISMVNHTEIYINEHPNASVQEVEDNFQPNYVESGEFGWNYETQTKIINLYMVTYTIFPMIAARAIMRFGLRVSIVVCLLVCAIASILTPFAAYWGWQWVVIMRLLMGAAASGVVPGMVSLIELWTHPKEAATGVVIYQFIGNVISVLTPLLSGQLAQLSWRLVFYVPGGATLLFCLIWWAVVSDSPETSRFISQKELNYIREVSQDRMSPSESKKTCEVNDKPDVKWFFMFKISEFYWLALIWCSYCATSGSMVYLLPTYLHQILKVSVQEIGMFTFIVQIGSLFSMLWPNHVVDYLMSSFRLSLTGARRVVVLICVFMAIVTILHLAAFHQHVVVLICIHRFFHMTHDTIVLGTVLSNFKASGTSGLVYSMLNSIGCITSTVFCIIVGKFLDITGETIECWTWVYVVMAGMILLHFVIYYIFCHSNPIDMKHSPESGDECK